MTRAETALNHIDLMTNDIFNAHDELESRSGAPGERVSLNGIPTLLYRFSDGSALSLSGHTDYAGNIHIVSPTEAIARIRRNADRRLTCDRFDAGYYITREPQNHSDTKEFWFVCDRDSKDRWSFDTPEKAANTLRELSEKRRKTV